MLFPVAFSDNASGHIGAGFWGSNGPQGTGSYAVYEDGVRVAHGNPVTVPGNPFTGLPSVRLHHKRSVIRFVLSGSRRRSYPLSAAFRTAWTWRSRPEPAATLPPSWYCISPGSRPCAVQAMMTLCYRVHGMSLHGTTAPGRQVIGLAVGHLQLSGHAAIKGATAQFSFDGGKTWRTATVTRSGAETFAMTFIAPAGTEVTLRTHAADTAGGSITETIQGAYRVR